MFLPGAYRCLGVIRALVSPSKSASLGTHNPQIVRFTMLADSAGVASVVLGDRDQFYLGRLPFQRPANKAGNSLCAHAGAIGHVLSAEFRSPQIEEFAFS